MEGLLGIVRDSCIWATDIRYLNDKSEMDHLWYLVELRIKQRLKEDETTSDHDFLMKLLEAIKERQDSEVFVSCFSERGDLLSQWRAYCSGTSGFSIGFDSTVLSKLPDTPESMFKRLDHVRYESGESIDRVLELAKSFINRTKYLFPYANIRDVAQGQLSMLAPQFKHHAFSEEKEWRVVRPIFPVLPCPGKKYRAGKSMLVPYIELKLAIDPYFIKEVIVGPSPNTSLSVASVKGLFESKGQSAVIVRESEIPYRYW